MADQRLYMRKSPLGSLRLCYLPTVMITVESRGLSSVSLALFRSVQAIANEIAHLQECSPRLVNSFGTVCRTCCTVVRECTKDSCGSLEAPSRRTQCSITSDQRESGSEFNIQC